MLRRFTACLLTIGVVIISLSSLASEAAPVSKNKAAKRAIKKLSPELETAKSGTIRVIVQTKGRPSLAQDNAVADRGGVKRRNYEALDAFVADIPASAIAELSAREDVAYISPDRPIRGQMDVARESSGAAQVQAGLDRVGGLSGKGIGIAIIDSGISAKHPDFKDSKGRSRVIASVDFTSSGSGVGGNGIIITDGIINTDSDDAGHGTGVAGVAAGNGAASKGYGGNFAGIAPEANLINLKALDANGSGTTSSAMQAVNWAIANQKRFNIRVINMSLGAPVREGFASDPLCQAVARAVQAGIVVVCSAGNHGRVEEIKGYEANGDPIYQLVYGAINSPGNSPYVITVGASDSRGTIKRSDDAMATFSSKGPTQFDNLVKPDIIASGRGVVAPMTQEANSTSAAQRPDRVVQPTKKNALPNAYYKYYGTSFSAPVVAGTVALMLEANKSLTPIMVKAALLRTAQTLPNVKFSSKQVSVVTQGAGLLNAAAAVEMADAVVPHANKLKAGDQLFRRNVTLKTLTQSFKIGGEKVAASNRVLYSDGIMFADRPVLTDAIMLGDGVMMSGGIVLSDGMALGTGILMSNGGVWSVTANGGVWSVTANGGVWSIYVNGGVWSVSANGGVWSVTANGGVWSVSANGGVWSVSANGGVWSVAANGGVWSVTANGGGHYATSGIILSDAIVFKDSMRLSDKLMHNDGYINTDAIMFGNGIIITDGATIMDTIIFSDGHILVDGIVMGDGHILVDGIVMGDGHILVDGIIIVDGGVWSGTDGDGGVWSGTDGDGGVWSGTNGDGGVWSRINGDGGVWS